MIRTLLLSCSILIISLTSSFSQVKEGDTFVDVYYGFPDLYKFILNDSYYGSGSISEKKITSTGYMGGRAEYMISKRIAFGLDVWYAQASMGYVRTENNYYNNYNYQTNTSSPYTYMNKERVSEKVGRLACLGRFIVHLGHSKKIDPYVHAGFGYVNYKYSYSVETIASSNNNFTTSSDNDKDNFFPLGARAGFGMRIFFTENFGANVDLGLGGALFTTGLTYKFGSKVE